MNDKQIVVFADERAERAYLLRERLAESGVEAFVVNDATRIAQFPPGWNTATQVVVAQEQLEAAQPIVQAFEAEEHQPQRTTDKSLGDRDERFSPTPAEPYEAARCPECDQPRTAVCPVCQTASAAFPPADPPPPGSAFGDDEAEGAFTAPMLVCSTCDEPFEPGYLPRCEWCGYDFDEEAQPVKPEPAQAERFGALDQRVTMTILALVASVLAVLAYFAILVSR